jgi:hypothetical protein
MARKMAGECEKSERFTKTNNKKLSKIALKRQKTYSQIRKL